MRKEREPHPPVLLSIWIQQFGQNLRAGETRQSGGYPAEIQGIEFTKSAKNENTSGWSLVGVPNVCGCFNCKWNKDAEFAVI
jgi:hypothetical protein